MTEMSLTNWTMTEFWKEYEKKSKEEIEEEADKWFDESYPDCSCLRCETKLDSKTVKFCGGENNCETWYCAECYEGGVYDCPCCFPITDRIKDWSWIIFDFSNKHDCPNTKEEMITIFKEYDYKHYKDWKDYEIDDCDWEEVWDYLRERFDEDATDSEEEEGTN